MRQSTKLIPCHEEYCNERVLEVQRGRPWRVCATEGRAVPGTFPPHPLREQHDRTLSPSCPPGEVLPIFNLKCHELSCTLFTGKLGRIMKHVLDDELFYFPTIFQA
jgi:hypothetical protein